MRRGHRTLIACFVVSGALIAIDHVTAYAQEAEVIDASAPPAPPPEEEKPDPLKTIAGLALSIGGAFVVTALVLHTLSKQLKYEQARNVIVHLLRTNPFQVEPQAATLPHSFAEPIAGALKTGGQLGAQDPSIITQATAPTYDALCTVVTQHWKGLVGKAKLAAAATVGGAVLKPGILSITLAVISGGGLAWLWIYKHEIERSLFRAKVEILPDVDHAIAQGRYFVPPAT
jgi:hypothetical protein